MDSQVHAVTQLTLRHYPNPDKNGYSYTLSLMRADGAEHGYAYANDYDHEREYTDPQRWDFKELLDSAKAMAEFLGVPLLHVVMAVGEDRGGWRETANVPQLA